MLASICSHVLTLLAGMALGATALLLVMAWASENMGPWK
jgi:hypothetical protein